MAERVLRAIAPSAAIDSWYRDKLQELIWQMGRSMLTHMEAAWKENPVGIGFSADASPTLGLRRALKKWGEKQIARFDAMAEEIAAAFATRTAADFDKRFAKILKDSGFTIRFRPTEAMREAYRAVVAENVNLIRSIPQKFLTDVGSSVWVSVMKGSDMDALSGSIKREYGVTWRRAALIARDQNSKARAVFEEARRAELGITHAIWRHSHAGKEPRPTHVAMNGKRYEIKKGMWDSAVQKFVWPGTEINCRCSSRAVFND